MFENERKGEMRVRRQRRDEVCEGKMRCVLCDEFVWFIVGLYVSYGVVQV